MAKRLGRQSAALLPLMMLMGGTPAMASSHREAPFITKHPKIDATDLYFFRSYQEGREGFVTVIANYIPLQDAYAGPNFFTMDPEALYEIHFDNNGDAQEDLTFQFRFSNDLKQSNNGLTVPVGAEGAQKSMAIPLRNAGAITASDTSLLNEEEHYTVKVVRGDRRTGTAADVTRSNSDATFTKPVDYIGRKSLPSYNAYANAHIFDVSIPGCTAPQDMAARVFVGQRKDVFAVNLGQTFDLINYADPLGARDQGLNDLEDKNVTSIALELPIACVKGAAAEAKTVGAWTTASMRQARVLNPTASYKRPTRDGGPWVQVSRLGMPLVNEVVIGLKDKDKFNSSEPKDDGQFLDYVTHPVLPELIEGVYSEAGVRAPNVFPRADLVAVFLTGVEGVNKTQTPSEMLRLNVVDFPPTALADQKDLGAAACFVKGTLTPGNTGCDPNGFPNGRRPFDDVVDLAIRVSMGYVLPSNTPDADASSRDLPFTDGAVVDKTQLLSTFPYIAAPLPGSTRAAP